MYLPNWAPPMQPSVPVPDQRFWIQYCTRREAKVISLAASGLSNSEIADRIRDPSLTIDAVNHRMKALYKRTGCSTRAALASWWCTKVVWAEASERQRLEVETYRAALERLRGVAKGDVLEFIEQALDV